MIGQTSDPADDCDGLPCRPILRLNRRWCRLAERESWCSGREGSPHLFSVVHIGADSPSGRRRGGGDGPSFSEPLDRGEGTEAVRWRWDSVRCGAGRMGSCKVALVRNSCNRALRKRWGNIRRRGPARKPRCIPAALQIAKTPFNTETRPSLDQPLYPSCPPKTRKTPTSARLRRVPTPASSTSIGLSSGRLPPCPVLVMLDPG